ncbi:hypothetical protein SMQE21_15610 [Serratia marcescens]|nr:hypothetical protein SMQE21_15610 [Serratia marcescens]
MTLYTEKAKAHTDGVILRHIGRKVRAGQATFSLQDLANTSCMAVTTVLRSVTRLESAGCISVERGEGIRSTYSLISPQEGA